MARNTLKPLSLCALIAALLSPTLSAQTHDGEINVFGGRIFFDDPLKDANTWGASLGFPLTDRWTLETVWSRYDSETKAGAVDVDGTQYRLDGIYNFVNSSSWTPYLALGVGDLERSYNAINPSQHRETLVNLGGGVKYNLSRSWQVRTDLRAFNSLDNEYTDVAVNVGLSYLLGKKSAPVAATPAPAVVSDRDSDGDGVPDSRDKCPDTPRTHKVDADGCSIKLTETVSVDLKITFDTNKAEIKPALQSEVAKLASFMNQYADTEVTVEGHTDSQGAEAYNQQLSQRRAEAVRDALINNHGISADRVRAVGYGESRPVADNSTAAGREQNRRVVGQVSTKVSKPATR